MPLPFILGLGAAVAGVLGVGATIAGVEDMKDANDTVESAKNLQERNMKRLEKENEMTIKDMDKLGEMELNVVKSFGEFSDVFEQIKNKPVFQNYSKKGVELPKYDGETLKDISVGAEVLLGGLAGAGLGTAGGFAAAGVTTSAVMALGTASTGTAISSLSGAAATKATLAALGGGAIKYGGGGIALGTTILNAATLGVGLLVGGIIFSLKGEKVANQANEIWHQAKEAEEKINRICDYLIELRITSNQYYEVLLSVNEIYQNHLNELKSIVIINKHTNWNTFTNKERQITENTVLLVGLLYNMCKVELVLKSEDENSLNSINTGKVEKSINNATVVIADQFGESVRTVDMKDDVEAAKFLQKRNMKRLKKQNAITIKDMDKLGEMELNIVKSFGEFLDIFEQIKNKPVFENYSKTGIELPKYDSDFLKKVSVGAETILSGLARAKLGIVGGFAAAGVYVACVTPHQTFLGSTYMMPFINRSFIWSYGNSEIYHILGSDAMEAAVELVGGIISSFKDEELSNWNQAKRLEAKIDRICNYLMKLRTTSNQYYEKLSSVNKIYQNYLNELKNIVITNKHTNWNTFTNKEQQITENVVLLVELLYNMCKVKLVLKSKDENGLNSVNTKEVEKSINAATVIIADKFDETDKIGINEKL